jgi:hypothetical protein
MKHIEVPGFGEKATTVMFGQLEIENGHVAL